MAQIDDAESALSRGPIPSAAKGLDRRRFLQAAGASATVLGAGAGMAACAAPAAVPVAEVAFNPATWTWLEDLATGVGAALASNAIQKGFEGIWSAWTDNVKARVNDVVKDYPYFNDDAYVHVVPPTALIGASKGKEINPMTDAMLACVNNGQNSVLFEPWAWHTLALFVNELTAKKTGEDLAGFQALCLISLIPSGVQPQQGQSTAGLVNWMSYGTRNGTVEIATVKEPDGSLSGTITTTGIPDVNGHPLLKKYALPTGPATT